MKRDRGCQSVEKRWRCSEEGSECVANGAGGPQERRRSDRRSKEMGGGGVRWESERIAVAVVEVCHFSDEGAGSSTPLILCRRSPFLRTIRHGSRPRKGGMEQDRANYVENGSDR